MLMFIAGRLVLSLSICVHPRAVHHSQRSNRGHGSLLRSIATPGIRSYLGYGL